MHFAVYGTRTKMHHRYPDLSGSKLGGWKHTTAFHKSFKTNRHQSLKHLRQYWCYGNRSVIGNRGGRYTFRNWGDIGLSPVTPVINKWELLLLQNTGYYRILITDCKCTKNSLQCRAPPLSCHTSPVTRLTTRHSADVKYSTLPAALIW